MTPWSGLCQSQLLAAIVRVFEGSGALAWNPEQPEEALILDRIAEGFGLDPGEMDTLVVAAAGEIDPDRRMSAAQAVERFGRIDWSCLSPSGSLRHWRLVSVPSDDPLHGRLRIDERVLYALLGVEGFDPVLRALARPAAPVEAVDRIGSIEQAAKRATEQWTRPHRFGRVAPVLQIVTDDRGDASRMTSLAAEALGLSLWEMPASALPGAPEEIDGLAIVLEREAVLGDAVVLVHDDTDDPCRRQALAWLVERCAAPLAVAGPSARPDWHRPVAAVDIPAPTRDEVAGLWQATLGPGIGPATIGRLAHGFPLRADEIRDIASEVGNGEAGDARDAGDAGRVVWNRARRARRGSLDGLAQRIDTPAGWDDLVLPEHQRATLVEIAAHVRNRHVVERWGFGGSGGEGGAVTVLFHGPSGVGKTLAARVLATELDLDLYRVDLSQTVSKYVGETEKNLKAIFDRAERAGAVLVFDEADALFGRRSEVRDAHDRYANLEVSYLLQRMESYRGLAVLTTNLPAHLDHAFVRRIRYSVSFPFPDQEARRAIWERVFPAAAPTDDLSFDILARLAVSGAAIANIALGAAVLAADSGEAIGMNHIRRAATSEYAKHDRALSAAELAGWPA